MQYLILHFYDLLFLAHVNGIIFIYILNELYVSINIGLPKTPVTEIFHITTQHKTLFFSPFNSCMLYHV